MSDKAPPTAGHSAAEGRESSDSSNARSEQERLSFQIALSRARAEQMARRTIDEAAAAPTTAGGASVPTSASVHHALGASNLSNLGGAASLQSLAGLPGNYGSSLYSVPGRPLTEFQLRNNAATTAVATLQAQSLLPPTTTYRIIPAPTAGMEASQEARGSYLQLPQQQYFVTNLQQPTPFELALAEAANRRNNNPPAAAAPFTLPTGFPGGIQVSVRRIADGVPATEYALDPRLVVLLRDGVGAQAGLNLLPSVMPLTGTVGAPAVSIITAAGVAAGATAEQQGNQDRRNGSLAPTGPKRKRRKYDHESFPEKLHRLIREAKDSGKDTIVKFSDDGLKFTILETKPFEQEILPLYFRHNNINSFKRLLRMYQFKKLHGTWMQGTFEHPLFHRDHPEWAKHMDRVGATEKDTSTE